MRPQSSPTDAPHLTRKAGLYYYRRRLPYPLTGEVGLSLRTRHYRRAEYLASLLDQTFARFVVTAETPKDLAPILREHLNDLNETSRDAERRVPPGRSVFGLPVREHENPLDEDLNFAASLAGDFREALGRRDWARVKQEAEKLMREHTIPEEQRADLSAGLLAVHIELLEATRLRLLGQPETAAPAAASTPQAAPFAHPDVTLSKRVPEFVTAMTKPPAGKKPEWTPHTEGQNANTLARFLEVCGDRHPAAYETTDVTHFLDTMARLPSNYGQSATAKTRSLTAIISEAEQRGIEKTLSRGTLDRHKATISKLFKFAIRKGDRKGNPVDDHSYLTTEEPAKRTPWTRDKLHTFFASALYTGARSEHRRTLNGPHVYWDQYYWLPVLGLYHGNRLEEFAQLRRADIREEDGIPYALIHDEGGNQTKNEPSNRRVPLHPAIITLGFLDYVCEVAPKDDDYLFPGMKPGGKGRKRGHYFSRRFTAQRRQSNVYERWQDFHSFRHGVETKLAGHFHIPDRIIDVLLGHKGEGTGRAVYLDRKDIPIRTLWEAIRHVEFPEVSLTRAKYPRILRGNPTRAKNGRNL